MSNVWERNVALTWKRDDCTCVYCHFKAEDAATLLRCMTVDHWVPRSEGGSGNVDNLRTACVLCNSIKGRMRFSDLEDARLYVGLYKELISKAWYEAHIIGDADAGRWGSRSQALLAEVRERYEVERAKTGART